MAPRNWVGRDASRWVGSVPPLGTGDVGLTTENEIDRRNELRELEKGIKSSEA